MLAEADVRDRTLIWNRSHLLHILREFEQSRNGHRPYQGIANARRSSHCRCRWQLLTKSPAFTYDDATDSVGYFMSTDMRHELHGRIFGQDNVLAGSSTSWSSSRTGQREYHRLIQETAGQKP